MIVGCKTARCYAYRTHATSIRIPLLPYDEVADAAGSIVQENEIPTAVFEKAAYLVDQALARRLVPLEVFKHPNYPAAKRAYRIFNHFRYFRWLSWGILLLFPFVKEPEWCADRAHDHCRDSAKYLLSGVYYVHGLGALTIEFLAVLPLVVSISLERYYLHATFWNAKSTWLKVGLLCALGLHMIGVLFHVLGVPSPPTRQMGLYLFVFTPMIFSNSLRKCFLMTIRIGQSYVDTAVLLLGVILMSAWLANLLFREPNFEDYSTSLLSLFVMITTANNPNVWTPTYERNHFAFFFFFCYMAITFFFLLPLLFALIYKNYKIQLASDVHEHKLKRTTNLRAAFNLLRERGGGISYKSSRCLFLEIGNVRRMRGINAIVNQTLSVVKNRGSNDTSSFGEFHVHCSRFVKTIEEEGLQESSLTRSHSRRWYFLSEDFLHSRQYQAFSFLATLTSLVVAILDHNARDPDFPHISHRLTGGLKPSRLDNN